MSNRFKVCRVCLASANTVKLSTLFEEAEGTGVKFKIVSGIDVNCDKKFLNSFLIEFTKYYIGFQRRRQKRGVGLRWLHGKAHRCI
jgi:hypothetical protein